MVILEQEELFEEAYDFDIDTGLEGNFVNGFYESEKNTLWRS